MRILYILLFFCIVANGLNAERLSHDEQEKYYLDRLKGAKAKTTAAKKALKTLREYVKAIYNPKTESAGIKARRNGIKIADELYVSRGDTEEEVIKKMIVIGFIVRKDENGHPVFYFDANHNGKKGFLYIVFFRQDGYLFIGKDTYDEERNSRNRVVSIIGVSGAVAYFFIPMKGATVSGGQQEISKKEFYELYRGINEKAPVKRLKN